MEKPNIRENIGKALLDIAKLTFASFILGGILRGELPQFALHSVFCGLQKSLKKKARSSLCG